MRDQKRKEQGNLGISHPRTSAFALSHRRNLTVSLEKIARATAPGGTVIISGLLKEPLPACLEAGKKAGIRWQPAILKGKWATAQGWG